MIERTIDEETREVAFDIVKGGLTMGHCGVIVEDPESETYDISLEMTSPDVYNMRNSNEYTITKIKFDPDNPYF